MGKVKKKKNTSTDTRSPVVLTASKVKKKYKRGFPKSPSKNPELRRLFLRYSQGRVLIKLPKNTNYLSATFKGE